jgi:NADPH2:quinone reductase
VFQREGHYPPPKGAPGHSGMEIAGKVVALGPGAARFQSGAILSARLIGRRRLRRVRRRARVNDLPVPNGLFMV